MSCSNQIICYTSPHLSLHVPFFFLLIILTHCYVIVYSFYYPPLQAYLQYKKTLSNIIHLSHRQILIFTFQLYIYPLRNSTFHTILTGTALLQTREHRTSKRLYVDKLLSNNFPHTCLNVIHSSDPFVGIFCL